MNTHTITKHITALVILGALALPIPGHAPQEDDPGWDCVTMGNMICGPDVDYPIGGDYEPDTGEYIGGYN